MIINIKDLGAIKNSKITIQENKINIKYGTNGIGKSTFTKGISRSDLSSLKTYGKDIEPQVQFDVPPQKPLIFNQDYVDHHLFKEDIVNNSFEIMINTDEYKSLSSSINDLLNELLSAVKNAPEITEVIQELQALKNVVQVQKRELRNGPKYSILAKEKFSKGQQIPDLKTVLSVDAQIYADKLKNSNNHAWLKWFSQGKEYIQNIQCPFCLKDLNDKFDDIYENVMNSYQNTPLKVDVEVKQSLSNVQKYLPESQEKVLIHAYDAKEPLTQEEYKLIYDILAKCDEELNKLIALKNLTVYSIKEKSEAKQLGEFLSHNKLDLKFYENSKSEVKKAVKTINSHIHKVLFKSKELSELMKQFNDNLAEIVRTKTEYIDNFLDLACIPYRIEIIESKDGQYKTVLKPKNNDVIISDKNLSYGERNAVSLILFSLEVNAEHDLIVLDDPVSSFDNNKKFAILYYMFLKQDAALKDKTVVMLTHDFDIIVDFLYKLDLKRLKPHLCYLYQENGELKEKRIKEKQVKETLRQWKAKASNKQLNLLLRIVNFRKYMMYAHPEEVHVINVLSSLEHNDMCPMKKESKDKVDLTPEELEAAVQKMKEFNIFEDSDYDVYRQKANDLEELKLNYCKANISSIEKLQLCCEP